jgi:hypothetical protein
MDKQTVNLIKIIEAENNLKKREGSSRKNLNRKKPSG